MHFRVLPKLHYLVHQLQARQLSTAAGATFRQVKQTLKQVDPYSRIRIQCRCNLRIVPADLLDNPDSNVLKVTLSSDDYNVDVQVSGKEVTIDGDGSGVEGDPDPECLLEVPIKSDLEVTNGGSTSIKDLYSDEIRVRSDGDIVTKSLRCTVIDLASADGNISCGGTTLAQTVRVACIGKGNILLDKLQGGEVDAESNEGSIRVNSSYTNSSSFRTTRGDLTLNNIHKLCRVFSGGAGKLAMNGFYGTLQADVASREVDLQLSELVGASSISATSAELVRLSISDTVHDSTEIAIKCDQLEVDPNMAGGKAPSQEDGMSVLGDSSRENKLNVDAGAGRVVLKKMSWADTFGFNLKVQ
ncbi:uncharacterized protein LOC6045695 [Culex quinquefasciatus]|uniref:uncharacterized protein LOC6045695 n=1 Tax=Culex quinquefasciatus TaxID=7176 RepID=UPI0018E36554|nr:uncharacterized protein LOC6045695 [Culex quinquefasciatus]